MFILVADDGGTQVTRENESGSSSMEGTHANAESLS